MLYDIEWDKRVKVQEIGKQIVIPTDVIHASIGVYITDFDNDLIKDKTVKYTGNKYGKGYGVCDNYNQVVNMYSWLKARRRTRKFVILLSPVFRENKPNSGFRWAKHGEYIGNHEIKYDYLNDEEGIIVVFIYTIYEVLKEE
jgi:hypothetical protein